MHRIARQKQKKRLTSLVELIYIAGDVTRMPNFLVWKELLVGEYMSRSSARPVSTGYVNFSDLGVHLTQNLRPHSYIRT